MIEHHGMHMDLTPATWKEAAEAASDIIFGCVRANAKVSVSDLLKHHEKIINDFFETPTTDLLIARWSTLGSMAIEYSINDDAAISQKTLVTTLCKKQHDYGPNNILRFGQQGLMIRVWDKISRLDNLTSQDYDPAVDESKIDTLLDIAGYSTIGIMLRRGWFRLPL